MATDPNSSSMWLPFVPELFVKVAHPVGVALRAAGQATNAPRLEQAVDVAARVSTIEEFDTVRFTQVLDAADQLPDLQGSVAVIDLRNFAILFEDYRLPKEQQRPFTLRLELLLEEGKWDNLPAEPPKRGFHLPANYRSRKPSGTEWLVV